MRQEIVENTPLVRSANQLSKEMKFGTRFRLTMRLSTKGEAHIGWMAGPCSLWPTPLLFFS